MSVIKKLSELGRDLAAAVRSATDDIRTLRGRITAKRTELGTARNAPVPPDEALARFKEWVDQTADTWRRGAGASSVTRHFGAPAGPRAPWAPSDQVRWGELCGLAGPLLKTAFAEVVRATEYASGTSAEARPGLVARLERELAELEATEEAAIDAANAAGISIAHRPEVLERRERDRRAEEQAAAVAANRAAREAAVPARPAAPGVVYSEYLRGGRA